MGPQNRWDGKYPDAMIKDFRALLDHTQDATHRMVTYSGTRECIKHKSCNKTYTSDEQLHEMELSIYHGIHVQVQFWEGEHISQMCRCPGRQTWHRGARQNDWVWLKQLTGRCHGALIGHLPWQLQWLSKIMLPNDDRAFVQYWLALVLTTIPETSGDLDPMTKCVLLRTVPAAIGLQVFSVGNIISHAHLIPEIARSSKTGDRWNELWLVNTHIDLQTWKDVYNKGIENWILRAGRRNARRDCRSVTHNIAIPMQTRTQWTYFDIWSQLATRPQCSLTME